MFTKDNIADVVKVKPTFPHLYRNEEGAPIEFGFELRMETEADSDYLERFDAQGKRTSHDRNVERLSRLLTAAPAGFDDFPKEGSLQSNAKAYFADVKFSHIVRGALNLYNQAVMPAELFR